MAHLCLKDAGLLSSSGVMQEVLVAHVQCMMCREWTWTTAWDEEMAWLAGQKPSYHHVCGRARVPVKHSVHRGQDKAK